MIKFDKNIWFLYYIISFLFIFNLALSFRIPLVIQLSGIIALCFLPGYLLGLLFSFKVTDLYENFLYSIGISIIFVLLFGLFINTLSPIFGETNPLSSQNLQIWFSIIILLLLSLIMYTDNSPQISLKIPKILKIEKIILIFGFIILVFVQIGIYLVNVYSTNTILIFSIFLIPILLLLLIIYNNDSIKRVFPSIIYLISISLLMLLSLRSNYIIGVDSHEEFYFFYTTLIHSSWIPDPIFLLSAALSISILPTIFENFLNIDPQLLFKILFPLIFSITPLIIYVIVKKYVNELLALFASCFFMFQNIFIGTTSNSRTSIGIFFVAFAVLVLCDKELSNTKKYMLLFLFIAGTIFSHYTTALIFLGILFSVYLMDLILNRSENRKENRFINLPLIIFFISLIFFWYGQIIGKVFSTAVGYSRFRMDIFHDLLKNDVSRYTAPIHISTSLLLKFLNYTKYLIFILIGIGILSSFYNWVQKETQLNSFRKFTANIDRILISLGVIAFGLLVCSFFAPFFFFGYDIGRLLELLFVILPVFLIIGACIFFNQILSQGNLYFSKKKFYKKIQPLVHYSKTHQIKIVSGILLFLLIPQLLFATYITNQLIDGPNSIIYNSPKHSKDILLGYAYTYDQDAKTLQWFKENSNKNAQIFSDEYGNKKIVSLINQPSSVYQRSLLELKEENVLQEYIFLTVTNEYYDRFMDLRQEETRISSFNHFLNQKNKIFANGAVLYK